MDERVTWRGLVPGIVLCIVLATVSVAVLVYGQVGALHGPRRQLHVVAPDAGGVLSGSDVWLDGRKIGRVKSLRAMPASRDSFARIVVNVEILDEYAPLVRKDANVRLASGGRLLGAPVVAIEGGSPAAPPVGDGDTLHSHGGGVMASAATRLQEAQAKLPVLLGAARGAMADLEQVSALTSNAMQRMPVERARVVMNEASGVGERMSRLMRSGDGTFVRRVTQVRARVDSLRIVAASPTGTLGRFRRDSTFARQVAEVKRELDALASAASRPDGMLGRMAADSALQREMSRMSLEMAALFADIRKRPLRYLSF